MAQTPFDVFTNDTPFTLERRSDLNAHIAASQPLRNSWSVSGGLPGVSASDTWSNSGWGPKPSDSPPAFRVEDYAKRTLSGPALPQDALNSYLNGGFTSRNGAGVSQLGASVQPAPRQLSTPLGSSLRPQNVSGGFPALDQGMSANWAPATNVSRVGSQPLSRSSTPGLVGGQASFGEPDLAAVAAAHAQSVSLRQRQDVRGSQGFTAQLGQNPQLGHFSQAQNGVPRASNPGLMQNANMYSTSNGARQSPDVDISALLQNMALKGDQNLPNVQEALLALLRQQYASGVAAQTVQGLGLQNVTARQAANVAALNGTRNGAAAGNIGVNPINSALAQQLAAVQAARAAPQQRQNGVYGAGLTGSANGNFGKQFAQQVAMMGEAQRRANQQRAAVNGMPAVNLQALQAAALLGSQRTQMRPAARVNVRPGQGAGFVPPLQHSPLASDQAARHVLLELGQTLAQLNISVEAAVNAGLLGGLGAADVKVVNDAHAHEVNNIRMRQHLERLKQAQQLQNAQVLQQQIQQQLLQQLQQAQLQQVPGLNSSKPPFLPDTFQLGTGLGDVKKDVAISEGIAVMQQTTSSFSLFDSNSNAIAEEHVDNTREAELAHFVGGLLPVTEHSAENGGLNESKPTDDANGGESALPETSFDAQSYVFFGRIEASEDDVLELEQPGDGQELEQAHLLSQPGDEDEVSGFFPGEEPNTSLDGDVCVERHIDTQTSEHRVLPTLA